MRYSNSRSRSRSKGNKRGGPRRSQERGGYKRSDSRSDSRGRDSKRGGDANQKRRNKFSDPSQANGGGNARGGFTGGFNNADSGDNFRGDRNFQGNQGFGAKGGQPQFGGQQRNNDNRQNGNGGFSYNNVRNQGGNMDDEIDKSISFQNKDNNTFNRNQFERPANGVGFTNNYQGQQGGSYDNYQNGSSLRQASSKISRKVYIPQDGKFNYIGLIIGPKGSKQKQLEEMTSCKILIRGKGSQKPGAPPQPDDDEDLHVLIEADAEVNTIKAMREIENIIFMDDDQKMKMRDSQLKSNYGGQQGRPEGQGSNNDRQTFIQVPSNVVGLVIGKKGESIKQIKEKSGADKVYMQPDNQRNLNDQFQNLIVEGSQESVEKVRELVNEIKNQQQQKKAGNDNYRGGGSNQKQEARIEMEIPANLAGLVIGSKGSTLQQVGSETRTYCQIQQNTNDNRKVLIIVGQTQEDCQRAKEIFEDKMNNRQSGNTNRNDRDQRGGGHMNNNRGGNFNNSRGGARQFNNRRPRKNADDDEIVENANQYDYFPTYNLHEQMMQNQQMLVSMQQQQQQLYQQPYPYPPQQQDGQQQYPPSDQHAAESKQGQGPAPQQSNEALTADSAATQAPSQQPASDYPPYQYPNQQQQYDPSSMQMQIQQYLQYQQMYMQSYTGPVIEEVLADGTVVSVSQNEDDKKKGKRGGRR